MINRRHLLALCGLSAAAIGLAACSPQGAGATDLRGTSALQKLPFESTPGVTEVARATSDLGWQILQSGTDANRAIAPSSLAITLGMLAEGARDETLQDLDRALGQSGDERSAALGALRQSLTGYESLPGSVDVNAPPKAPVVHQASQVVIVDDHPVEQHFLDRLSAYFDAGAQKVELSGLKALLDVWVSKNTAGLIDKSAVDPMPGIALVLQDAILFAAAWRTEFRNDDVPLDFRGPTGTEQVKALGGSFNVPWVAGDGWSAVRLPYDDNLAMDVILPDGDPAALDATQIDATRTALDGAGTTTVELVMPPSDLTTKWKLLPPLKSLGIDFGHTLDGIFPAAEVSDIAQQVRLMTSAKGTVGAAVTEVAVGTGAPAQVVQMVVDRPFVMRVLDVRTGWPLFLAVVSDAQAARPRH